MAKFVKKPIVVEAIKLDKTSYKMEARVGDYIIKGVKGEFYPCQPDIFAATYDELPAPPPLEDREAEKDG